MAAKNCDIPLGGIEDYTIGLQPTQISPLRIEKFFPTQRPVGYSGRRGPGARKPRVISAGSFPEIVAMYKGE